MLLQISSNGTEMLQTDNPSIVFDSCNNKALKFLKNMIAYSMHIIYLNTITILHNSNK